jgi:hypothetical protein
MLSVGFDPSCSKSITKRSFKRLSFKSTPKVSSVAQLILPFMCHNIRLYAKSQKLGPSPFFA